MNSDEQRSGRISRRDFVKSSTVAGLGLSAGLMGKGNYAFAAASDTIRIGLIGCGGRGTGAAVNALEAAEGVELVAMGDAFEDRLDDSREKLRDRFGAAFKVTDATAFNGFDAYEKVIAVPGVNYVILAAPPVFRPMHLRAAIDAGHHVFMEKPVAVDPVGCRAVIEISDLAAQKGLGIVAGTQRRHQANYIETIERVHDGAIGEVLSGQVFWNQGALWKKDRQAGWSDMEWQLRNWLYFTYLSGDHIVEQHIHNIDVANWILDANPVKAVGVGGRQVRVSPEYGHIFDHFAIDLEYPNGARVLSMCRQQDGTAAHVGEHFIGTKGSTNAHTWIRAASSWRFDAENPNPYMMEHKNLIASIRAGSPLNEGRQMAETNIAAIMAREAAYTGLEVTFDEVLNSGQDLTPKHWEFGPMPFPPVPVPGVTKLERTVVALR
jgi:myo-inositol 2-dehydrogenase / D-chiro-inositol 1-dehydrogenase